MRSKRVFLATLVCVVGCLLLSTSAPWAQVEAICVPWESDPDKTHYSYSGAQTRLKGIARGGATEFRWDFGDGTSMPWTAIGNPYNLEAAHTYAGLIGQQFIATLFVRDALANEDQDTYWIKLHESTDLGNPLHLDVRRFMAVDEGLWWLHKNMVRGTYGGGEPGYGQPYGYWNDPGGYPLPASCTSVDAFQIHGSKANGVADEDPYVETVRRALNYVLANTYAYAIDPEPAGDPDTNANGIGIVANWTSNLYDGRQTYIGGICATALASSVPNRVAEVGREHVLGETYATIVQDMVDFFAWGQVDSGSGRGGWRYHANYSGSDMSTAQWPPLAMIAAEENMGAEVPQFVRDELPYFLNQTFHAGCDNNHGGYGYSDPNNYINSTKAAAGIICHEFLGTPYDDVQFQGALGFLYRHWNDTGSGWTYQRVQGNSYVMYGVMKAMRIPDPDLLRLYNYDCGAGQPTEQSFDWFYTPSGQTQTGLASYNVSTQHADGSWDDTTGPNRVYDAFATGWRTLILLEGVVIIPPDALICDCDEQEYNLNQDIHLDGSCSSHPDSNRSIVQFEWDLDYDGTFVTDTTGAQAEVLGGYGVTGLYPMALRVTDDRPDDPQTDVFVCEVDVHPPPHCPHAFAGGPYLGFVNTPLTFDASASWDPDNEIVSYDWDLDNDGLYGAEDLDVFGSASDAVGVNPQWTWSAPYVGVIGLRVIDAEGEFPACEDFDFTTVDIGNHEPVAVAGGPYLACQDCTVTLDGSGSYDIDPGDMIVLYEWDLDNDGEFDDAVGVETPFTVGDVIGTVYDICLRVTDTFDETGVTCTTVTIVEDAEPPVVTCEVQQSTLWPPNHKMADVGLSFTAEDAYDPGPLAMAIAVLSDEHPALEPGAGGDGHCPDASIGDDSSVSLRKERSGEGDGRVYTIVVSAMDAVGNVGTCEVTVDVPHDHATDAAVNSGADYDATDCGMRRFTGDLEGAARNLNEGLQEMSDSGAGDSEERGESRSMGRSSGQRLRDRR